MGRTEHSGILEIIFPHHFPSYKSCLGSIKPFLMEYYALINVYKYIWGGWGVFSKEKMDFLKLSVFT